MIAKKGVKTKKSTKNKDADLSELDMAVSELARQTEALLGKTGEKMKPTLPKKKSATHPSARSFDIIHAGDQAKKAAVLKSAKPAQKALEPSGEELLPAAVKSEGPSAKVSSNTEIVTTHKTGSLKLGSKEAKTDESAAISAPQVGAAEPVAVTAKKAAKVSDTKESPEDAVSDSSDDEVSSEEGETPAVPNGADQTSDSNDQAASLSVEAKVEIASDPTTASIHAVSDASQNIQLYSDNLTSESSDAPEGEDKTDIFDTDQYHPTLHDWSKLEHKSKAPLIGLLLLTIIFAAGVYVVSSGYTISF